MSEEETQAIPLHAGVETDADGNTKIKVSFAPGAFDSFDGTQEELDELIKEIQDFFANHTAAEIKEMSTPLEELSEEELAAIDRATNGFTPNNGGMLQ